MGTKRNSKAKTTKRFVVRQETVGGTKLFDVVNTKTYRTYATFNSRSDAKRVADVKNEVA